MPKLMIRHTGCASGSPRKQKKQESTSKLCIYLLTLGLIVFVRYFWSEQSHVLMPPSRYKYVSQRARIDKPWQAVVAPHGYLGSFKTEDDAAKVVARKLGRPKASLLRIPKNKIISERIGMCIGTKAIEVGK